MPIGTTGYAPLVTRLPAEGTGTAYTYETNTQSVAFGNIVCESNTAVDHIFAYTGRERDEESDLYFYRARYYDPAVGRFVSEDPISSPAKDWNFYRYVGNNPVIRTDPTGLVGEDWTFFTRNGEIIRVLVPHVGDFQGVTAVEDAIQAATDELELYENEQLASIIEAAEAQGSGYAADTAALESGGCSTTLVYGGLYTFLVLEVTGLYIEAGLIGYYTGQNCRLRSEFVEIATQSYISDGNDANTAAQKAEQELHDLDKTSPGFGSLYAHYFHQDFIAWWWPV